MPRSRLAVADTYRLRLLTAQRNGEVMGMPWPEIDLEGRWWTIPADRSKNGKAHRVWLSDPVMRILKRRLAANQKRKRACWRAVAVGFSGKSEGKHIVEPKREVCGY